MSPVSSQKPEWLRLSMYLRTGFFLPTTFFVFRYQERTILERDDVLAMFETKSNTATLTTFLSRNVLYNFKTKQEKSIHYFFLFFLIIRTLFFRLFPRNGSLSCSEISDADTEPVCNFLCLILEILRCFLQFGDDWCKLESRFWIWEVWPSWPNTNTKSEQSVVLCLESDDLFDSTIYDVNCWWCAWNALLDRCVPGVVTFISIPSCSTKFLKILAVKFAPASWMVLLQVPNAPRNLIVNIRGEICKTSNDYQALVFVRNCG